MRHTWLNVGLTAAALTAALTVSAGAASIGIGTVKADALNLRSEANTSSATQGLVYNGAKVDVLEDAGEGWYKVSYDGKTGYMLGEYLIIEEGQEEAEEEAQAEEATVSTLGNGKITLTSGTLNVRAAASIESARVGTIPNGAIVALESYENGWYQVTYGNASGYVRGDYVTLTTEEVTPVSTRGQAVVDLAKQYLGCPYVYGSAGPKSFDCSGFTYYIYRQLGYTINRTASSQLNGNGTAVDRADLQPGDLVFFRDYSCSKSASHVGIYVGGGQFIHASSSRSGSGVRYSSLSDTWYANRYVGARRIML